ncbi:MAG TPA: nucleotidyl transferase AbiEii/AbiGii toxin family protein [Puia sp.]|jgi:predicted nucleotidyltransferase component of viral defense system|nr:nucleotidyl transferase AbiEii/AbiGii toxin family protein [Puia sp.]
MAGLFWNTVDPALQAILADVMTEPFFEPFRLVGGTALSLQLGHRKSVDIDLFTDALYGSIDFDFIDTWFRARYAYVSQPTAGPIAFGHSYFIGEDAQHAVKIDIYYTDPFIRAPLHLDGIRMASTEEITAMKVNVIQRGGRKKDFWDIHELHDTFSIAEMIAFHAERYPYEHDEQKIRRQFTNFATADDDFDPNCIRGKYWELIKLDLLEML